MLRTRVGYAGGSTIDPTYGDLADHTEVLQLDFDPSQLSYATLLDEIWRDRRGGSSYGRHQYMEAIFCDTEEQAAIARARVADKAPVIVGAPFYRAEDYHQKHRLRRDPLLLAELADYTPRQFVDSTIATRLNGYVAGHGTPAHVTDDLARFGLSPVASAHVLQLVTRRR